MNKRQKKNRKRLLNFTRDLGGFFIGYSMGLLLISKHYFNFTLIILYILMSIILIILVELCDYLKIEI